MTPNPRPSITQHYHQRTKYDPQLLASRTRELDFANQPDPFKTYQIGTRIDLFPYLKQQANPDSLLLARLSELLFTSYGITAKVPYPGQTRYLRSAPSAGGLYPAEIYLIARDESGLPAGLYHYQSREHALCRYWDSHVWSSLESACLWHPAISNCNLVLVVTAIFFRSAWRYEDRAYRRIFLDTGHLLANLTLAASLQDYRAHLIGGFVDQPLNDLLYLDSTQEGALAILALADLLEIEQNLPLTPTALPSATVLYYPTLAEGELLSFCHQATSIQDQSVTYAEAPQPHLAHEAPVDKYNFPFGLKVPLPSGAIAWGEPSEAAQQLRQTLIKRRSTRHFSAAGLDLEELALVLDFAYHPEHYLNQGLDQSPDFFDLSLIETFVAVSDVVGLDAGCYYYAANAEELRQVRFKNFRRDLHYLCLQQELGLKAAVVIFHTADLGAAIAAYGDRAYRYLHMDAGHLGQRLNLAAVHLNLGVSGIGGFFDDQVNELLSIPNDEAVLYITVLGRPA
jgi:SagB-type dehydrogenase family enzyme